MAKKMTLEFPGHRWNSPDNVGIPRTTFLLRFVRGIPTPLYIEVQTENVLFDYRYQFEVIYNDWSPYNKGKLLVVEKLFETLKITISNQSCTTQELLSQWAIP